MKIWIRAANQIYLCDFGQLDIQNTALSGEGEVIGVPGKRSSYKVWQTTTIINAEYNRCNLGR